MTAFYNEIDPYAANWLRNLIKEGHIAPGVVDERSIEDIEPEELHGYKQVHFFAGIGVWSYALRRAGWPDDLPVWTGSCPCQPFSTAGKGAGFDDERHLWPALHHLIRECNPPVVFGEQVASKDGLAWIELVRTDLEGENYAVAAADLCAAGVGAPHIRQRLYWVADANGEQHNRAGRLGQGRGVEHSNGSAVSRMGHSNNAGLEGHGRGHQAQGRESGQVRPVAEASEPCRLAYAGEQRFNGIDTHLRGRGSRQDSPQTNWRSEAVQRGRFLSARELAEIPYGGRYVDPARNPGPTNGHWRDADWLHCRDGKWRPVEPGTFPLAHGAPARVGRLRAYGNAIVPQVAQVFIESYLETQDPPPVG